MKLNFNSEELLQTPTYFIADIAANHDGSLERALNLIKLAAEAGADAAKFQNFKAETIVSKNGFDQLGRKLSHQAKWETDVFSVYKQAELPLEWTGHLIEQCEKFGIDYFTAPYDLNYIDYFADKMPYFKIGSGDITWRESIERMVSYRKPIVLATGASTITEIQSAVSIIESAKIPYVLMQCNTNYTGDDSNFNHLNILVLNQFKTMFPKAVLGLSDHSPGHIAVLGAVALGARVIEKHFTDDNLRKGPDHEFSLNPVTWKQMVDDTRILERTLGDGVKKVENNEIETRILQRRAYRFTKNFKKGHVVSEKDLIALRPCPEEGISPFELDRIINKELNIDVETDQIVKIDQFKL